VRVVIAIITSAIAIFEATLGLSRKRRTTVEAAQIDLRPY
jgi:hypothetical protein